MNNTNTNKSNATNDNKDLFRYGMQLAMLNKLLSLNLMNEREHYKVKVQLMKDYGIEAIMPV